MKFPKLEKNKKIELLSVKKEISNKLFIKHETCTNIKTQKGHPRVHQFRIAAFDIRFLLEYSDASRTIFHELYFFPRVDSEFRFRCWLIADSTVEFIYNLNGESRDIGDYSIDE